MNKIELLGYVVFGVAFAFMLMTFGLYLITKSLEERCRWLQIQIDILEKQVGRVEDAIPDDVLFKRATLNTHSIQPKEIASQE